MMIGINIITDEFGNIQEENKIVIEDGRATTLCKERHYVFNWDCERG